MGILKFVLRGKDTETQKLLETGCFSLAGSMYLCIIQRSDQSDRSVSKYYTCKRKHTKEILLKLINFNEFGRRRYWSSFQVSVTSSGY